MKMLLLNMFVFCAIFLRGQTIQSLACTGVHAEPLGSTFIPSTYSVDTVYLPTSGILAIQANFNFNCKSVINPLVIDWVHNNVLIATATPTYNMGVDGYSTLTINQPGTYKAFFKGYYSSPTDSLGVTRLIVKNTISTGINYTSLKNNFKIYPNPTVNDITIEFDSEIKFIRHSVYDIVGKMTFLSNTILGENKQTIKLPEQPGIYFIKVESNKGIFTTKIIKN